MAEGTLVLVFVPALAAILMAAEDKKGAALTRAEVTQITQRATVIAVPQKAAADMEAARGYSDIDPENAYAEWRELSQYPAED